MASSTTRNTLILALLVIGAGILAGCAGGGAGFGTASGDSGSSWTPPSWEHSEYFSGAGGAL